MTQEPGFETYKGFPRFDSPDTSLLSCPCGSSFEWSDDSDGLRAWTTKHAPHLKPRPEVAATVPGKHTPGRVGASRTYDGALTLAQMRALDEIHTVNMLVEGPRPADSSAENARRIAAAWNAVEGLSTEQVERLNAAEMFTALRDFIRVTVGGVDADGPIAPKHPLSFETVARMAWDIVGSEIAKVDRS